MGEQCLDIELTISWGIYTANGRMSLWQDDINKLAVDAIVNVAKYKLLGCLAPGHSCIDNAIRIFTVVHLWQTCYEIMRKQGHDEPTVWVNITSAYNLQRVYGRGLFNLAN